MTHKNLNLSNKNDDSNKPSFAYKAEHDDNFIGLH